MANIKLWTKQHSPELLLAAGITTSASSVALAVLATKKLDKVMKPHRENIVTIHDAMDNSEEDPGLKRRLRKVYVKMAWDLTKLYAPSVISFGLSTASLVASHNIMRGRNIALAAAAATLKGGYDAYRAKVAEKLGDEAEKNYLIL